MRIISPFLTFVLLASTAALAQQSVPHSKPAHVTAAANAELVKLLQAGIPESVVLDKIRSMGGKFNISADALIALKKAGATEAELSSVLAKSSPPTDHPTAAATQQAVPPPPKPEADNGQLLETMRFVKDGVEKQGEVRSLVTADIGYGKSWAMPIDQAITFDVANSPPCQVNYHKKSDTDLFTHEPGSAAGFDLKQVKDVIVMTVEQMMIARGEADGSHYQIGTVNSTLAFWVVRVRRPNSLKDDFYFLKNEEADSVAQALVHAVEICGGGS